ncbi:AraC family transcriptional regulator [Pigmentiphaga soli]|uniref:AraC family transcriptional regulator n=1 Tax=Pigmentiphaga soli TaxID=1007095 RepID=A0ABP8GWF7_9BURK
MHNALPLATVPDDDHARGLEQLASLIARFTDTEGNHPTAIPALTLHRSTTPGLPFHGVYEPVLAVIAQGAKRVTLAGQSYEYGQARYLIASVDLPVTSQIIKASPQSPYLCLTLGLDVRRIGELMTETGMPEPKACRVGPGLSVDRLSAPLLDAVLRLVRLLDTPEDIPILAPLIEREIFYRLLTGNQGMRLRHIAVSDSQSQQIARAIAWLRKNFARPLRIDDLAQAVNMSTSSLHHHFKAVTAMSPLQYQKQLRLQEARRLIMTELRHVSAAAHLVGYESPSQFIREYRRLYGAPPMRDASRLRGLAADPGGRPG